MLVVKCKVCNSKFLAKQSHVKKGWGKYCSRNCQYKDYRKGHWVQCDVCERGIYRSISSIQKSNSKKFFCNKTCQAMWRNVFFSGEKYKLWKGGFSAYRDILRRKGGIEACAHCGIKDKRVLAVHHINENHPDNRPDNLAWLCHNCHRLVHHNSVEKQKFMEALV